jgi:hypothetical protein
MAVTNSLRFALADAGMTKEFRTMQKNHVQLVWMGVLAA